MRRFIFSIAMLTLLICSAVAPVPARAATTYKGDPFATACTPADSTAKTTVKGSTACTTTGADPITGTNGILYKTSRILALVAAVGAVIMIIIGGFMYVTAGGDEGKAGGAKKMITAAVGGLVVIGLAELIVAFVVNLVK